MLLVFSCLTRGLFGNGGASQLGPVQFASLGAGSSGFRRILSTCANNAHRTCTLRLGLQVVLIPFVPASNLFFKAWLGRNFNEVFSEFRRKRNHNIFALGRIICRTTWANVIGPLAISERAGWRHHWREVAIPSGFGKVRPREYETHACHC